MKSIGRQLIPAVLVAAVIVMWSAAQQPKPITVTRSKGHLTRTLGTEDRVSLIVPLAGQ
jgi:hypothetical protein